MNHDLYPDRLGFVYVLSSRLMVNPTTGTRLLKIGATRKHPIQRAKELSAGTGVPEALEIVYYRDYEDAFLAERLIHEAFGGCRVNDSREFFDVAVANVVDFMEGLVKGDAYQEALASGGLTGGNWIEQQQPQRRAGHVATPFAELFATFEDRSDGVLNAAEQAACRALEAAR